MPRTITGYVYPLPTEVYNAPILKTDVDGYIIGEEAPNHYLLVGGDTEVKSIVGTTGQILISNGALADPAFVDTSTVPFANIAGGNKNDIVYQFDTDNTDFTPAITLSPEEVTLGVTYVLKQAANALDYPKFTKNLVLGTVSALSLSGASVTGGIVSGTNLAGLTGAKFISGDITGSLSRGTVLDTTAGGTGNTTGSISGGSANQIPYQFTNDLTYFTGPGQTGQVLIGTTGAPPSFSNSINGPVSINSTGTIKSASLESLTTIKGIDIEATSAVIAPFIDGLTTVTAPAIVGITSVTAPSGIFPTVMQSGSILTGAIGCGIITSAAIGAAAAVTSAISVSAPLVDGVNVTGTNFTASGSIKDTSQARPAGWASMRIDSSGRFLGTDIVPGLASEIQGGTAGAVVYQAAVDDTAFVTGTANQLLQSNGTSAPTFTSSPTLQTLQINNTTGNNGLNISSTSASNILIKLTQADGSNPNRLVFENTTDLSSGELSLEPTGEMLLLSANDMQFDATEYSYANLANATYLSTNAGGKLTVNASFPTATLAADIQGGTANQIVYQSGVDSTSFVGPGLTNQILVGNTGLAPSFTSTPTVSSLTIDTTFGVPLQINNSTGTKVQVTQTGLATDSCLIEFYNSTSTEVANMGLDTFGRAVIESPTGITLDTPVNTLKLQNYGSGIIQSTAGTLSASSTLPATTITNAVNAPAFIINQNGIGDCIRVNCTTNSAAFVYNIPAGQLYNGLYVQASAAQGNLTYYSAGARISLIGQAATTNNFQVVSDRAVLLQGANGTIINQTSASINTLIWNQNAAANVSSISQESSTGIFKVTSDKDITITPGTTGKTSIVKTSTTENKLEFSQNAGAKISSISQADTTGNLVLKSDTFLNLDAPTYKLTGINSALYLKTNGSGEISAGLTQKPVLTYITAAGLNIHALQAGITYIEVWLCAGGGGGAGGNGSHGGGAGGGGTTAFRLFTPTTGNLNVILGAGGAGGAYTVNGSSGTASEITEIVALLPQTRLIAAEGGGGDINASPGAGGAGGTLANYYVNGGTSPYNWHDDEMPGGSSYFTGSQMPVAASTRGGGGRGGTRYAAGQDGGTGVCLIKEYFN